MGEERGAQRVQLPPPAPAHKPAVQAPVARPSPSPRAKATSVWSSAKYRTTNGAKINGDRAQKMRDDMAHGQRVRSDNAAAAKAYRLTNKAAIKERRVEKRRKDSEWAAKEGSKVKEARRKVTPHLLGWFEAAQCGEMGRGVVARCAIKKGTMLPLAAVAIREAHGQDGSYQLDSAFISVNAVSWDTVTVDGVVFDAHPKLLRGRVHQSWALASYINEARLNADVNCELFPAPHNTADDITTAYRMGSVILGAWMIVTRDVAEGEQLLTHYGTGYTREGYKVQRRIRMPASDHQFGLDVLAQLKARRIAFNVTEPCRAFAFSAVAV
ncbi:hypothetical protein JKP88DRAFT_240886 [Tribonema minus]|uniref:SET domain-containing protein n=1 Tax=Tribonema minus TaxID=303371 RepID=A0A835Z5X5_9STRA|nr:hypothetical protein JKP88DRAFT_240886 [Tribonema minus]